MKSASVVSPVAAGPAISSRTDTGRDQTGSDNPGLPWDQALRVANEVLADLAPCAQQTFKPREGDSDGGYAVADYRTVRPDLGTIDDLRALATTLRRQRISLVMDLVLNHVAAEHEWARAAVAGVEKYRDYFLHFAQLPGSPVQQWFSRRKPLSDQPTWSSILVRESIMARSAISPTTIR